MINCKDSNFSLGERGTVNGCPLFFHTKGGNPSSEAGGPPVKKKKKKGLWAVQNEFNGGLKISGQQCKSSSIPREN